VLQEARMFFRIQIKHHYYCFTIKPINFVFKELPEHILDSLLDIQITYVESHGAGMGGSPHDFHVERMKEKQVIALSELLYAFFEGHKLDVVIKYYKSYD